MTTSLPPEVPGHVRHENHVQNHVKVEGGTNWDFSRSAVATPLTQIIEPEKTYEASIKSSKNSGDLTYVTKLKFPKSASSLPQNVQNVLSGLPASRVYQVEARADTSEKNARSLAQKRKDAVSAFLLKRGIKVSATSSAVTVSGVSMEERKNNQSVDILVDTFSP